MPDSLEALQEKGSRHTALPIRRVGKFGKK